MWCPNCKTEYRKGVTVCADCGAELVEGTAADFNTVDICEFKDEKVADQFLEYLNYSGIDEAKKQEKENEKGVYLILVPEMQQKRAEKLFHGYLMALEEEKQDKKRMEQGKKSGTQQAEDADHAGSDETDLDEADAEYSEEETEYDWDAEDQEKKPEHIFDRDNEAQKRADNLLLSKEVEEEAKDLLYTSSESYTTKEDDYKDLKFSGITFIIFSILGGVFLTLCHFEILPIHYQTAVFIAIACIFVIFFFVGIDSLVKSYRVMLQIPAEVAKTDRMMKWLREELTQEIMDGWKDAEISDVENDLLITSHIRASLIEKYPMEKVPYLEYIADRYYTEYYVNNEQDKA